MNDRKVGDVWPKKAESLQKGATLRGRLPSRKGGVKVGDAGSQVSRCYVSSETVYFRPEFTSRWR